MRRARRVAAVVALTGLVGGWVALRLLTGETGAGTRPYRETVGFALATPAGLVVLSYLADVFRSDAYYAERGVAGVAADFALSTLAAAVVGLAGTAAGIQLGASSLVLFGVATSLTFAGAAVTFLVRTGRWQEWDRVDGGS